MKSKIVKYPELRANSVDPNQTTRCAVSDLSLHCSPVSLLWDAKHKWIKSNCFVLNTE